jgi:hypothetical protein
MEKSMLAQTFLAAAAFAIVSTSALARSDSPIPDGARVAEPPNVAAALHKTLGSVINNGSAGASLVGGFNNVDSLTSVGCSNAAGCTIDISAMMQFAPPAGTYWAICPVVNGTYTNPPCPYQGTAPAVGSYVTGNGQGSITVPAGTSFVQTQIYVSNASTMGNWQVTYTVMKP